MAVKTLTHAQKIIKAQIFNKRSLKFQDFSYCEDYSDYSYLDASSW